MVLVPYNTIPYIPSTVVHIFGDGGVQSVVDNVVAGSTRISFQRIEDGEMRDAAEI